MGGRAKRPQRDSVAVDRVAGGFPSPTPHHLPCLLAFRRQNVYLLPDVYGAAMPGHLQWVDATNTYLQDRLLFGSAFPVLGVPQMVEGYRRLPYREVVREKVLHQNAAKLLGLPVREA